MSHNIDNLGLPLEYQQMPEYFDAHNVSEETNAKNAVVERLLKEQNVKTVLDMTCGTGSQVFYLTERKYKVTGSDFSPALLEQARQKAKELSLDIDFIDGDMRDLHVGEFDAVITMFNAIGHLSKQDFEKSLQNTRSNLKDGGFYVFDILNLDAVAKAKMTDFDMDIEKKVNGTKIHNKQYSTIDKHNGLMTSYDDYTIFRDGHAPEKFTNEFTLQIYTAKELSDILTRSGFEIIGQYGMYGETFIEHETMNILTVAKKI